MTDGQTTDRRRRPTYPISSPMSLRLRWANTVRLESVLEMQRRDSVLSETVPNPPHHLYKIKQNRRQDILIANILVLEDLLLFELK